MTKFTLLDPDHWELYYDMGLLETMEFLFELVTINYSSGRVNVKLQLRAPGQIDDFLITKKSEN